MDLIIEKLETDCDVGEILDALIPDSTSLKNADLDEVLNQVDQLIEARSSELTHIIRRLAQENSDMCWPVEELQSLRDDMNRFAKPSAELFPEVKSIVEQLSAIEREKESFEHSVSVLEKIEILRSSLDNLKDAVSHKDYAEVKRNIELIQAVEGYFNNLDPAARHCPLPEKGESSPLDEALQNVNALVDQLLERKSGIFKDVLAQVLEEIVATVDDCDSTEFFRNLCEIIAFIDPQSRVVVLEEMFKSRLSQYNIQFQLRQTSSLKNDRKTEAIREMETFQKRHLWLMSVNIPVDRFPASWKPGEFFLNQFSALTRNHLIHLLDVTHDDLSYPELCELLKKVRHLEQAIQDLSVKWSIGQEDTGEDAGSKNCLTKLFDAFTQPWYKQMCSQFAEVAKITLNQKDSVIDTPKNLTAAAQVGAPCDDVAALMRVSAQPKSIFLSASRLVDRMFDLIKDCETYSVNQMLQDSKILIERNLAMYIERSWRVLDRWKFNGPAAGFEKCHLIDWETDAKPSGGAAGVSWSAKAASKLSGSASSGSLPTEAVIACGDFTDLLCLFSTLEWLWLVFTQFIDHTTWVERGVLSDFWRLRVGAEQTLLKHFLLTTLVPLAPLQNSNTGQEFLAQWKQWAKELPGFLSPPSTALMIDTTTSLLCHYARGVLAKKERLVSNDALVQATQILEWVTEEHTGAVVALDELKTLVTLCKGLF